MNDTYKDRQVHIFEICRSTTLGAEIDPRFPKLKNRGPTLRQKSYLISLGVFIDNQGMTVGGYTGTYNTLARSAAAGL